jgi:hypothetical protein
MLKPWLMGIFFFFWLFDLDLLTFLELDPQNCDRNGFCIRYSSLMVTNFLTYVEAMADGHFFFWLFELDMLTLAMWLSGQALQP